MKIALICDLHYGNKNDSPIFHDYFKRSADWFLGILDSEKINTIIDLGDLLHRRKYVNYVTANRLRTDFLDPIEARGIKHYITAGNHDLFYRNTSEINALDELIGNRYKNLHFFKEPWTLCFQGLSILLIPWINESNKQVTYDAIKDSKAPIAMGHLEISGFEMFRGLFSDHGDSKEIYDKFDQVFSGHYHHKSSIGNITYLGAFTEQTWADFNDPKGFHIFDTKSRELTFYKNPISIFKVITYDDTDPATMDFSSYRDCYVKVAVLNRPNAYKFEQFMDTLSRSGALDISVVEDSSSITEINEEMSIDESQDTGTILTKYIENLTGLPVPNDKMIKYMTEIYNEALNMETTIDSA